MDNPPEVTDVAVVAGVDVSKGLKLLDAAKPSMRDWGFTDRSLSWPVEHSGRVDSPSSALLVWVWEHLGALLKSVDRLQRALARSELARAAACDALDQLTRGDGPEKVHAALVRQAARARSAGEHNVASALAQRLGLPLDHADNLPLVMAALDAAVKDAAAFRKLGEEVKTIAEDVGMDVQAVEDRTRAAATALCDRMADDDPG